MGDQKTTNAALQAPNILLVPTWVV
jgi:hypothetical protein